MENYVKLKPNFYFFQGDFIAGAMQEFFGSYDAPPYTVENTFEVDGQKVKISWNCNEKFG